MTRLTAGEMSMATSPCPICTLPKAHIDAGLDGSSITCMRCGIFEISRSALDDLPSTISGKPNARHLLSFFIRKRQQSQKRPSINSNFIRKVIAEEQLPSPAERADYLVLALGNAQLDPGQMQIINPEKFMAIVGTSTFEGLNFVVGALVEQGLVEGQWRNWNETEGPTHTTGALTGRLTFRGWERFYHLTRIGGVGTRAFLAMKFNDAELDEMVRRHMRPAVEKTGFAVRRLDDEPRAGLIDDRLRLEIRLARFLLADLTHANNGAYWEAGYAEGLGKPVIYLCKKAVFDDPGQRPHFDTNHHLTITWDGPTIADDMERLKATIRFSIPEARQSD